MTRAVVVGLALVVGGCGTADGTRPQAPAWGAAAAAARAAVPRRAPTAVGLRIVTFTDPHRHLRVPGRGLVRRRLVTVVRYPARGPATRVDVVGARPARGPFPLVVFGHGFAESPAVYASLLEAWARAGYVVAAPVFPLENAAAPGGPKESDLVHQPADMSLVIAGLLAAGADSGSDLRGLIDPGAIAVAGHSDGGETALAVAYAGFYLDRRVGAAVILSGANTPSGPFSFPSSSPPLLATQGSADTVNPPGRTQAFFDRAPPPKYLLTLLGAPHLSPYTDQQPELGIVERVTIAFLDRYLKHTAGADARLDAAGRVPGSARMVARP